MSLMQERTLEIISFLSIDGPLVSPANTTLLVVVSVSHPTRYKESFER